MVRSMFAAASHQMIGGIRDALPELAKLYPKVLKTEPRYPSFEVFAYLLFLVDYLASTRLNREVRGELFHFLADAALEVLDMERSTFDEVLNMRMKEYAYIATAPELEEDKRNTKRWDNLVENLAYALDENALFQWEGDVKPFPCIGAITKALLLPVFGEMLMPTEARFLIMWDEILKISPDFPRINADSLEKACKLGQKRIDDAEVQLRQYRKRHKSS